MAQFEEQTGRRKEVTLIPEITRAFWSRRRAWQGQPVHLMVETRYLKNGTPLKIEIWEDGVDEKKPNGCVAKLPGEHKVQNNRCVIEYKIQWDPSTLGHPIQLEHDRYEFCFIVTVEKPALKQKSNLLYVDLHPLIVSA